MLELSSVRWLTQHSVMHAACNKQYKAEIGAVKSIECTVAPLMLTHGCGTIVLEVSVSPFAAVQAKLVG